MAANYVQSLFIFFALFSLLGGLGACLYFQRLDSSARYWTVATVLAGATNLATVFRSEIPPLWSYSVAIGLSGTSFVLMGLGIARLYNRGAQRRTLLALGAGTVVFIAVMEGARIHAGPKVTLLLSGGLFGLSSIWGAWVAHVHHRRTHNQFSMHMRWVMASLGVLHLLRTQGVVTGWGVQTFGQEVWTFGIWSGAFVLGMLRYFAYLAMRVQEQADEKVKVAAALVREEEGRRLGGQLARLERQQSLGVMSASFAHELNQPLAVIRNYAELLQHQLRTQTMNADTAKGVLDDIIASSVRAADIIRRIRVFIQPAESRKERIDLRTVVQEVLALVNAEALRAQITLVKPPMPHPIWVQADAIELSQVLFNVVRNAMDALQDAQERRIELTVNELDGEVQLQVYDTGPGLSETSLQQAGEPFYTTKVSGLGMGLSISRIILAQYGGRLSLDNTERGTCACIGLPRAEAP